MVLNINWKRALPDNANPGNTETIGAHRDDWLLGNIGNNVAAYLDI